MMPIATFAFRHHTCSRALIATCISYSPFVNCTSYTAHHRHYENHIAPDTENQEEIEPGSVCDMDAHFKLAVAQVDAEMKRMPKPREIETTRSWTEAKNVYPRLATLVNEYVSAINATVVDEESGYLM